MNDFTVEQRRRPYIVPLQVMVPVTLITIYFAVTRFRYMAYAGAEESLRLYFFIFLWPLLMLGETAVYWIFRYKFKANINITLHLVSTFIAFVLLNILFVLIGALAGRTANGMESFVRLSQLRVVLFWLLVTTGHAFFATALVKVLRKKDDSTDDGQPKGLLDDILEEE